jgi:hypothetical protein
MFEIGDLVIRNNSKKKGKIINIYTNLLTGIKIAVIEYEERISCGHDELSLLSLYNYSGKGSHCLSYYYSKLGNLFDLQNKQLTLNFD